MKNVFSFIMIALVFVSCKKKEDNVSRTVKTASYPVVEFAGVTIAGDNESVENYYLGPIKLNQTAFITYPVGATVNLNPKAYDTVIGGNVSVEVTRNGQLNTAVPGLYVYDLKTGINANGYGIKVRVFIGITNNGTQMDLSGSYRGVVGSAPDTLDGISIAQVAPSMYLVSDPAVDRSKIGAVFIQTSDTTIAIGMQPTDLGDQNFGELSGADGRLQAGPADTVISYRLINRIINKSYPASTRFYLIK